MNELDNGLPEQYSEPEKKKDIRKIVKRTLVGVGLALAVYWVYCLAQLFISPDRNIQQIYLVPEDATFIIQSSAPVNDWEKFSGSKTWQCLKKAKAFEEITMNVETLDSIVKSNKVLLSLVGKRDMLISIHKIRSTAWDFLILLDMQKVSKMDLLKDQIETVMTMSGYSVTNRMYNGINILEMRDPDTRDIFYSAFVDNHFVASYTSKLVESAIDSRDKPKIGLDHAFIEAEKLVSGKGLVRVFINYAHLPQFMSIYLGAKNEYVDMFSNSMDFAGLFFNTDKDRMEVKGYTLRKEVADPYVTALLNSGKHKMKAHEIMSGRTALYTNIGFSDPVTFMKELENALSVHDKQLCDSYKSSKKKIEGLFGISLEENFLSWMSGEFAIAQSEPGLLGHEPELILAIRAKSIEDARKNMEYIEKKIKRRTPIKIKTVNYKNFEINYVEMKGFFRLFFGGLFDKFEKPYYTYIDDYVVFSNKASSLLSFVEDYEQKNLLKDNPGFKNAYSYLKSSSTVFLYTDVRKFYLQLRPMMNMATWNKIQSDKEVLYSFPYWTMQIVGNEQLASLHYVMDYSPYEPEDAVTVDTDEEDKEMNEDAVTEKEQMSELERFYVEKFEGNVLREFYPEGALKSEVEVKEGKRHGRYREYYENGKLKLRGKYANNLPKGTWKYYTDEGEFEHKEKF
ncbi:toxin-antitoxin system YwqK family antitoxin [Bacteroides sp.]